MIWDWLNHAECLKHTDKRTGKSYNAWIEHVSIIVVLASYKIIYHVKSTQEDRDHSARILLVVVTSPDQPVALLSRLHDSEYDMRFMSFAGTEPAATAFTVPDECKAPKN